MEDKEVRGACETCKHSAKADTADAVNVEAAK